ncbi:ATP-binding cassette sub-family A member 1 [Galendromus occidentalis]|uniref:ATP-binding cassette sub-family A member 1 n=1 Tax=Galendromus occidentalis TaxID=34638 RepID=A0AAJ7SDV6_9ACAR|nr:ATP-binding cassette sub-family A member 1 [Galendromus occidentalis]
MGTAATDQLRLVVWKNLLLRKRRPVILCLEVLWPIVIFLLLVILRLILPATHQSACFYNARALPSAGGLQVIQGLICNIDNQCLNRSQFEDIPTYPGSRLDSLVGALTPLFNNGKLLGLARELPTSARLLDAISNLLAHQSVKRLLVTGVPVENLVIDVEEARELFLNKMSISPDIVDSLLKSKLSLPSLVYTLITKHAECDESLIRSIVISDDRRVAQELTRKCPLSTEFAEKLQSLADVKEVIRTLSGVAEALDQPRMAKQIEELTEVVRIASKLKFGHQRNKWSEVVRLGTNVINDVRNGVGAKFAQRLWRDWGRHVLPKHSADLQTLLNAASKVFNEEAKPSFEDSELNKIIPALRNMLQVFKNAPQIESGLFGVLNGNLVDLAEHVGLDADWLNIGVHLIGAEASAIPGSHTFPYFPRLLEAAARTLADREKRSKIVERRSGGPLLWEENVCNPAFFEEYVVHSDEARIMSRYACSLLKQVLPSFVDKVTGKVNLRYRNASSTPAREAMDGLFGLMEAIPKASPYEFQNRLDNALMDLDHYLKHEIDETSQASLLGSTAQLVYDYFELLRPDYAVHIERIAAAVSSVLDIMSRYLSKATVSGEISWASALGSQSLQRTLNSLFDNIDSLLVASDAVLTKGLNASKLLKDPDLKFCSRSSPLSSYLIVEEPEHFAEVERSICSNIESIYPEMSTSAPVKEILSLLGRASLSNVTDKSVSWNDIATRVVSVRKSLNHLNSVGFANFERSLEPFARFVSGIRVLLGVPSTKTEVLRLKTRALELALNHFEFDEVMKSVALKLVHEMSNANAVGSIPDDSSSILRWSEQHLPEFMKLFLQMSISKPEKIRSFFQHNLTEICQESLETILELNSTSEAEQKLSDNFNDLCERLLSGSRVDQAKYPPSIMIRKFLDGFASFWDLASANQTRNRLFDVALWRTALLPTLTSSGSDSVFDLLQTSISTLQPFLPLKQTSFGEFQCSSDRASHSELNLIKNVWSVLQNLSKLIDASLRILLQPNHVKQIAPLVRSWFRNGTFCQSSQEDFRILRRFYGSAFTPLNELRSVICVSAEQLALEFPECSADDQSPTSAVSAIKHALLKLAEPDSKLTPDKIFSVFEWYKTALGVMNILQNGLTTETLKDPQTWLELFEKNLGKHPQVLSELRQLIIKSGDISAQMLAQNSTMDLDPTLLRVLKQVSSSRLLETAMWFSRSLSSNSVVDFRLESLESLLFDNCGESSGAGIHALLCGDETRRLYEHLRQLNKQKSNSSFAEAVKSIVSLLHKIDPRATTMLRTTFSESADNYQRRLPNSLAKGIVSTLWLSDIPDDLSHLLELATTVTEVLDVLPPYNVSNFLVHNLTQPSPDFGNLRALDDDPVRQLLINNLVPIAGGLQDTGTILINLWNSQDLLLKSSLRSSACKSGDSVILDLMKNLGSPLNATCQVPGSNLGDAYQYLMDRGLERIVDIDAENICYPQILSQFATWSRVYSGEAQILSNCFKALHNSNTTSELAQVARTAASLFRFIPAFSGIKGDPGYDPLDELRREFPVRARFEDLVSQKALLDDLDDPSLNGTVVDARWLSLHRSPRRLERMFCEGSWYPVIVYPTQVLPEKYCSNDFAKRFLRAIDFDRLGPEIRKSQNDTLTKGLWLRPFLRADLFDALGGIGRNALPFIQLSEEPLTLETATALLVSLKEAQLKDLHEALHAFGWPISEVFTGSELDVFVQAIRRAIGAVKEMSATGLFNVRFKVTEVLNDPESARKAIIEALGASGYIIDFILSMEFDVSPFLVDLETRKLTFVDVVGDVSLLKRAFSLPPSSSILDKYSNVLRQAVDKLGIPPNPLVTVAQQKLLKNVADILLVKALRKNDLTWDHLVAIFSAFNAAPQVASDVGNSFATIKDVVGLETIKGLSNLNVSVNGVRVLAEPVALKLVGRLTCGRPLRDLEQEFKILQPSRKEPQLNEKDIEELPEEFCRNGYEQVMRLTGGPIIWGFLKPILRGKLLYAPDTEEARLIVTEVNRTFESIGHFRDRLYEWGDASNGLKMMLGRKSAIDDVKDALFSHVMEPLMRKILPAGITKDTFDLNVVQNEIGDAGGLADMLQLVSNISHCFTLDRFEAVPTEEELEILAPKMTKRKEFIAAMVFDLDKELKGRTARTPPSAAPTQKNGGRGKRGLWEMIGFADDESESRLPYDIRYKIRMDIDNVPLTHRIKDLFWKPGAKADFFEDMRYQRGFSQMQQIVDAAILRVLNRQIHNGSDDPRANLPATFVQQFPYPCYENDEAGHLLKSIVPLACLLSWLFCVAFLIRQRVLDREQHLQEVLAVMGLRAWIDLAAWVLLSGAILGGIVAISTGLISVILPNSDLLLLFIFYSTFALSLLSFCYLVSNIFQNNATLAALAGTLLYIISFIPFVVALTSEASLTLMNKLLLCTSMSSAFCYGSLYITRFEQQTLGLTWHTAFKSPLAGDEMSFMFALGMLILDSVVYSVIGWYCGHVFCNNPNLRKKWYFVLQSEFWTGNYADDDDIYTIDEKGDGVEISDLLVRYPAGNLAVNKLSLTLRDGEITSLLGQNGAGKTTTIRVLTGQCRATTGRVQAYGIDSRNLPELRRLIGYCPQYNTLFDKLTVREHLMFFAKLKSTATSKYEIDSEVRTMLRMMDLAHVENRLSCELSGGLQRRLCVGLSFIGGSKLIILDEPTSSVDPVARRHIWDLVLKYRQRRTILLTTHHMDEADILSDKVAVIQRGSLVCQGSPITLKTRFGCGYQLTLCRNSSRESDSGLSTSDASLTSNHFSVDIIDDIREFIPSASIIGDEADCVTVNLPHRSEAGDAFDFAAFFRKLDTSGLLAYHGFNSYRVSCTTLEDAFLNLSADNVSPSSITRISDFDSDGRGGSDGSASPVWDSGSTSSLYLTSNRRVEGMALAFMQLRALLWKHSLHSMRSWKVLFSSVIMPCIFIALAMGITTLKPDNIKEPALDLDINLYGRPAFSVLSSQPDRPLLKEFRGKHAVRIGDRVRSLPQHGFCPAVDRARRNLDWGSVDTVASFNGTQELFLIDPAKVDLSDYLLATYADYSDKRYGGWSLDGEQVKVWYDNTAHHSLPIYQNQLTNAVLRRHFGNYTVRVVNHPLHLTHEQLGRETFLSRLADLGVALVILIGLGFIPASAVIYVVRERAQEEKTVQHCSGVSKTMYWSAIMIWDLLVLFIGIFLCSVVIRIFAIPVYVDRDNFSAVVLLLLLFGFSSLPVTQLISHLFHESSIAFMVTYCLNLFLGLGIFLVLLLCNSSIPEGIHLVGLIIPQYSFIQGVLVLFKNHITADIYEIFDQDVYEDPLYLLRANYIMMLIVGTSSFFLNIIRDYNMLTIPITGKEPEIPQNEDADVMMERKRVVSAIGDDVLSLVNLTKDYKTFGLSKPHRAVDSVSFGIGKGVCFGLLGLNGAGKTTLFKILTGHIQPTSGRAFLKDKGGAYRSLGEFNHHVGYCPQGDAVDDLLTPEQQLTIYAQMKGIPENEIYDVVQKALAIFQLQSFANRPCIDLSRGTRRKVCTAMAFLGDPQLVLLDEPTTGMDPLTRRLLWSSVQKCVESGRSVLLTSHSMEECEALCNRLGIMANGRLRCIGCPDALKYRFSQGFTLGLRIEPGTEQTVLQHIKSKFPSARPKALHATSLQISVPSKEASLSSLFALLQDDRSRQVGIVDHTIQLTTLDQVFVEFVSQQKGEEDDEESFSRVATVSSFGSASYQQLSSKDGALAEDGFIDCTHF